MALGQRLADQIKFDTVRQNNKRIVLCIDYSTSMNEARLPIFLNFLHNDKAKSRKSQNEKVKIENVGARKIVQF